MVENIRLYASITLSNPDLRKLGAAYERLFGALRLVDDLPAPLLEALDEAIANEFKDRRGPLAEFMKGYRAYLRDTIAEAKNYDRKVRSDGVAVTTPKRGNAK